MNNSYKFYCNKSCEYYPCHKGLSEFNCLFCFCPLYRTECSGSYVMIESDGRKIKGTIHWLSAQFAKNATVALYDKLFNIANTADIPEDKTYDDYLNHDSVTKIANAKIEPSLENAKIGERFQFVRTGYFTPDSKNPGTFIRTVTLKDSYKVN